MNFAIEIFLKILDTKISRYAIETASRNNVYSFFAGQLIILQLHELHIIRFTADIDVMCSSIDTNKQKKVAKFDSLIEWVMFFFSSNLPSLNNGFTVEAIRATAIDDYLRGQFIFKH